MQFERTITCMHATQVAYYVNIVHDLYTVYLLFCVVSAPELIEYLIFIYSLEFDLFQWRTSQLPKVSPGPRHVTCPTNHQHMYPVVGVWVAMVVGTVRFCSCATRLNFKLVPLLLPTLCPLGLTFLYIYILGHSCGYVHNYIYDCIGIYIYSVRTFRRNLL